VRPQLDLVRGAALEQAWVEAQAAYWVRRARTFEDAAPRPGDFIGLATAEDLDEQAARCVAAAVACRNRATLADVTRLDFEATVRDLVA
jgi:hypothetical protein